MKKRFLMLTMVFFGLFAGVGSSWAQQYWLTSLKAQTDGGSQGAGQVKLNLLDIQGYPMENTQFINPYTGITNTTDFGETAQLVGITVVGPSQPMETYGVFNVNAQQYMTSYAYFHAENQPDDGSYLAEWTFNPQSSVSYVGTMGGYGKHPMPNQTYQFWSEPKTNGYPYPEEDNITDNRIIYSPEKAPCFRVLPNNDRTQTMVGNQVTDLQNMLSLKATVMESPNIIQALFNKYTFDNASAVGANVEAEAGNTVVINVTVDVVGDAAALDAADFDTFTFSNDASDWTYDLATALANKEVISALEAVPSAQRTRLVIPVTYTVPANVEYGVKSTTLTLKIAGDNSIDVGVSLNVKALDPNPAEAFLYDGMTQMETEKTTLAKLLAVDVSGYTNPILKLNTNVDDGFAFSNKNITIDLNGNTVNGITVSSGEITIAFSQFGGNAGAVSVTGGKAILNGGTLSSLSISNGATAEQNGASITGSVTNHGTLTTTEGSVAGGLTSDGTLTVNNGTFAGETAITISGGTAAINRGRMNGTTCGLLVSGGEVTVKKLAAISGGMYSANRTGGTLTVECGKFGAPLHGTIDFTCGFFTTTNYGVSTEGKTEMLISAGVEYTEGYTHFLGTKEDALANGVGVCRVGTTSYAKLEDAIAYANNNPGIANVVIFMTNDYTLPAGYYTLPANATIIVPMSDTQLEVNTSAPRKIFNDANAANPYEEPTEFRRLTFASGVNMDVFGKIEMTCSQFASNEAYTAQPCGTYGHLVLEEGSHLTLQDGSEIRAWGFVTGKGEIDARRGSKVREMFQMGDWKGAMTSVRITGMVKQGEVSDALWNKVGSDDSGYKIFPVTQYFIQNVESPVKYHPGAVLSASAAVSEGLSGISISMAATDIAVVGVSGTHDAIFLMDIAADADNTWVRKWYDAENDIQVYDINSGAHIGSMELDMGNVDLGATFGAVNIRLNSAKFDLPLTSNMKIHLLSGTMDFKQNTNLLPGAEVEVDKESTVSVAQDHLDPDHTGALYVYDAEDWDKYAYCNEVYYVAATDEWKMQSGTAYTKTVRYSPSWNGRPTKRNEQTCPADAAINVHGTFTTATGFVYTSNGGANIFSGNEDAGTFIFNEDASAAGTRTVYQVMNAGTYQSRTFYPAKLKNGDGTYVNTNSAVAGDAYCYQNDEWSTMTVDEVNKCFMKTYNGNTLTYTYYSKPAEYVAVVASKEQVLWPDGVNPILDDFDNPIYEIVGNADHTYSDAAGAGRLFILMNKDCQWWEVEKKDNLYHCIHPDNDTYYYWVDPEIEYNDSEDPEEWEILMPGHWEEKKFTITWLNWDGTLISTNNGDAEGYEVTYGTMAEFYGSNPTRENNIDSTYNFTGWKPALGPVTQDVTYTATYESQPRMYTIIFRNEGGTEIERQFLTHNAVPVCENTPTKIGHILQWSPAISPVIGDQIYTATWLEELPTEWDVTFVNNANGVLQASAAVGVNEHPVYSGSTPIKENADHSAYSSNEYTYTFWGWSAVIDGVAQQFAAGTELPCPNAPTTYTAVYTEDYQTYGVTFQNENGTDIETNYYRYGETPVCSATPTKPNTVQYTYSFAWTPQIQTVQGAATYRAVFTPITNKYTVTLTSNLNGVCTFTGAGTFDYGTNITNVAVTYNSAKYIFDGWSDGEDNANHPSFTLESDVTLTANFTPIAIEDHTVTAEQTWNVPEDTEVKDLIITSNGSACGQLLNPENLTIRGEAIYRMTQTFAAGQWYAVAVPWRVNPNTGIYGASGFLSSGSQIYIIEFDGAAYANDGGTEDHPYWKFLHQTGNDMVPGKLYMIYLASAQTQLDFYKKSGAALQTRNLTVSTASGNAGAQFANWNAISNPALYTADLGTGVSAYQTYDNNGAQTYTVVNATTNNLIVAKPIFVQVSTPSTVYATIHSGSNPVPAYRRAPQADNEAKFVVEIANNGKMADRLIVQTAEKKANEYIIGQDLAKFGVSSKVAQIWVNRYGAKLCVNAEEIAEERAEYPLSIFAPAAGEYTITIDQSAITNDAYALYLTYNGEAIWNLSDRAYVLNLNKGTDSNYGLRVSARAPQTATGVDEAIVDAQGDVRKVLINNQVFIIRGDKVYSIDGQLVN